MAILATEQILNQNIDVINSMTTLHSQHKNYHLCNSHICKNGDIVVETYSCGCVNVIDAKNDRTWLFSKESREVRLKFVHSLIHNS